MVEVFARLGLALLLSLGLAVLMAWGWNNSDRATGVVYSAADNSSDTALPAKPEQ